jgi:hypothetical protein
MLVDNKFISLMIPRCATTSFLHTCQVNEIKTDDIKTYGFTNLYDHKKGWGTHYHESLYSLQEKFGYNYPIIGVKRNKIDSFISLWKQTIKTFQQLNEITLYNKLIKLDYNDILFFKESDYNLLNLSDISDLTIEFCTRMDIPLEKKYLPKFNLLFKPQEFYHQNNPNIIWFDFNKLDELEEWVSSKLERDFKLIHLNSSTHIECNLKNDDNFKNKFNSLYGLKYELFKNKKSLI